MCTEMSSFQGVGIEEFQVSSFQWVGIEVSSFQVLGSTDIQKCPYFRKRGTPLILK